MVRDWHFQLVCQGLKPLLGAKGALDTPAENAKTLTMESKDRFGRGAIKKPGSVCQVNVTLPPLA